MNTNFQMKKKKKKKKKKKTKKKDIQQASKHLRMPGQI